MSYGAMEQKGFRILGIVQGVYYRVWTRDLAQDLGLRGTVRNRPDGSVECHVVGPPDAVSSFEACLWDGPSGAVVEGVKPLESSSELPIGPFQILPTA